LRCMVDTNILISAALFPKSVSAAEFLRRLAKLGFLEDF